MPIPTKVTRSRTAAATNDTITLAANDTYGLREQYWQYGKYDDQLSILGGASTVTAGAGIDQSIVDLGAGNDSVTIEARRYGMDASHIQSSGGNNLINISAAREGMSFSTLSMTGTGNDTYRITSESSNGLSQSRIEDKGGNNLIDISGGLYGMSYSTLSMTGTGNDTYRITGETYGSFSNLIEDKGGNNLLDISGGLNGMSHGRLSLGTGSDTYRITGEDLNGLDFSLIEDKGGNNLVDISGGIYGMIQSTLSIGAGNDTYRITGNDSFGLESVTLTDTGGKNAFVLRSENGGVSNSALDLLAGNSTLNINSYKGMVSSSLMLGKGADVLEISSGDVGLDSVTLTDAGGKNNIAVSGGFEAIKGSTVSLGTDADLVTLASQNNVLSGSQLNLGGGNDTVYLEGLGEYAYSAVNSTLDAGAGNDLINLRGTISASTIDAGAGNDVIHLYTSATMTGNTLIDGGAGTDKLNLSVREEANLSSILGTDGKIQNVEVLNLTGNGRTALSICNADMDKITHSAGTLIKVDGEKADTVHFLAGEEWVKQAKSPVSGYSLYRSYAGKEILIKSGITVTEEPYTTPAYIETTKSDGSVTITQASGDANITLSSVVQAGSSISLGNGDSHLYFSRDVGATGAMTTAPKAVTITAGNGDNYIGLSFEGATNLNLKTGNGNDTFFGDDGNLRGGIIDLGNGSNQFFNDGDVGSLLSSDGKKLLSLARIKTGTGNDSIFISSDAEGAEIIDAGGNNNIDIGRLITQTNGSGGLLSKALIQTGAGHDSIHISSLAGGTVQAGNGHNTVTVFGAARGIEEAGKLVARGLIQTGTGNDSIKLGGLDNADLKDTGGHNTVLIRGAVTGSTYGAASITLNGGNDTLRIESTAGKGVEGGIIKDAGGHNLIDISANGVGFAGLANGTKTVGGQLTLGAGHDSVTIASATGIAVSRSALNLGAGDNNLSISGSAGGLESVQITTGAGHDRLEVTSTAGMAVYGSGINLGAGQNVVDITGSSAGLSGVLNPDVHSYVPTPGNAFKADVVTSLTTGAGDDIIRINTTETDSAGVLLANINMGNGNNTLSVSGTLISLMGGVEWKGSAVSKYLNTVTLGTGHDVVELDGIFRGVALELGEGNNSLIQQGIYASGYSSIHAGKGADTFTLNAIFSSKLTDDGGNNSLVIDGEIATSTISLGKGNDTVDISSSGTGSTLYYTSYTDTGGNNSIAIANTGTGRAMSLSTITLKAGNNSLDIDGEIDTSTISLGKGNDLVDISSSGTDSALYASSYTDTGGNNSIAIANTGTGRAISLSTITLKAGNNELDIDGEISMATISLSKGNDTVHMSCSNTSTTLSGSTFTDAGGNNVVSIENTSSSKRAIGNSTLTFGDGHDTLDINGNIQNSVIKMGKGNDLVCLENLLGNDYDVLIDLGAGNDTLMLESGYTLNLSTTGNQLFVGGAGVDVANLDGIGASINLATLTTGTEGLTGFEILDLSGDNANTLTLTSESLQNLAMDTKLSFTADGKAIKNANAIRIQGESEDSVIIDDRSEWCDLGQTSVGNISYDVFSTTDDDGKALYMLIQAGLL